jgi:hypothetical protein
MASSAGEGGAASLDAGAGALALQRTAWPQPPPAAPHLRHRWQHGLQHSWLLTQQRGRGGSDH